MVCGTWKSPLLSFIALQQGHDLDISFFIQKNPADPDNDTRLDNKRRKGNGSVNPFKNGESMIYYAGPLFNAAERAFNVELTAALESLGCEVFLPQWDGVEANKLPYSEMSRDERRKAMFELDRDMIEGCDIFLFVLDGRIPDEGACVELGIAYAHRRATGVKRILLGFQTDIRSAFMGSKLNPMIRVPLDYIVTSTDELLAYISEKMAPDNTTYTEGNSSAAHSHR